MKYKIKPTKYGRVWRLYVKGFLGIYWYWTSFTASGTDESIRQSAESILKWELKIRSREAKYYEMETEDRKTRYYEIKDD